MGLIDAVSVRPRIFISYHHSGNQYFYDSFSNTFSGRYQAIYDNSLERRIDSDDVNYVIRRIRENYITGTSCTIVLIGEETWGRKYVDWEIKATLDKQHGLIGIILPTNRSQTPLIPSRLFANLQSKYALLVDWNQVTQSPEMLRHYIAAANSHRKSLIDNTQPMRIRNG